MKAIPLPLGDLAGRANSLLRAGTIVKAIPLPLGEGGPLFDGAPGEGRRTVTHQIPIFLSLNAFKITDSELRVIAALAIIGLSSTPKNGYNTPAAIGIPRVL